MFPIYFYAPTEQKRQLIKKDYNTWIAVQSNFTPWIGQTYFNLKKAGFSCQIISQFPEEGIVLADVDSLGNTSKYLGKLMLICAKSDRDHHPSAHIHITHNPFDYQKNKDSVWNSYFLPQKKIRFEESGVRSQKSEVRKILLTFLNFFQIVPSNNRANY